MNRHPAYVPALLTTLFVGVLLGGCVADRPSQKKVPLPPMTTQPTAVGVYAQAPADTNANGYTDTLEIVVYVSSEQYAIPLAVPGSFQFQLTGKNGAVLATWNFDEVKTGDALRRLSPGPGYMFRLNVLETGTDEYETQATELSAEFRPRVGVPVRAPLTPFRFGKMQ